MAINFLLAPFDKATCWSTGEDDVDVICTSVGSRTLPKDYKKIIESSVKYDNLVIL